MITRLNLTKFCDGGYANEPQTAYASMQHANSIKEIKIPVKNERLYMFEVSPYAFTHTR